MIILRIRLLTMIKLKRRRSNRRREKVLYFYIDFLGFEM
jgi:hypothetical protein